MRGWEDVEGILLSFRGGGGWDMCVGVQGLVRPECRSAGPTYDMYILIMHGPT